MLPIAIARRAQHRMAEGRHFDGARRIAQHFQQDRDPHGTGVRVDSAVYASYTIPPFYDPMISKLIVWGRDRQEAINKMDRALYEYVIVGSKNNIPFLKAVMKNPRFVAGDLGTRFIESETTLFDEMKSIMEREKLLQDKLSNPHDNKKQIAAITTVAALRRSYQRC